MENIAHYVVRFKYFLGSKHTVGKFYEQIDISNHGFVDCLRDWMCDAGVFWHV